MKFTLSWLEQFLELNTKSINYIDKISECLTNLGHEVEEVILPNENLKNFTVAYVLDAVPHPNADKLRVCKVQTVETTLQIVCGAPNARAGIKVALAKIGTEIPNGNFKIKESEIRGVKSQGMLCSASELLLGPNDGTIIELPIDAELGKPITEYYTSDIIFDINVTPNRGDVLSVYGIARELAAKDIGTLRYITPPEINCNITNDINIHIDNSHQCSLYAIRAIHNLTNQKSPKWLSDLLTNVGINPISCIVDITNYIALSFGQPLHAYDKNKISNNLYIKTIKDNTKFIALNNIEYELPINALVISDDNNIQCVAGIIGSKQSAVTEKTTNIVLEAAVFNPHNVIETGRHLQIHTESKHRFERGIDQNYSTIALNIATQMILKLCGGNASNIIQRKQTLNLKNILFPFDTLKKITGLEIPNEQIMSILLKLGCDFTENYSVGLNIIPPSWRHDLNTKEDIVEEIIRVYGYEHIPLLPLANHNLKRIISSEQKTINNIKRALATIGYNEVVTWSFMKKTDAAYFSKIDENLEIINPISSDLNYLRPSIIPNLLKIFLKNEVRGNKNLSLFEAGPIFNKIFHNNENFMISGIRTGLFNTKRWDTNERKADVYDIKSDLTIILENTPITMEQLIISNNHLLNYYHPTKAASLILGKKIVGYFGELHPKILQQWGIKQNIIAFELDIANIPLGKPKYGRRTELILSDLQPSIQDFAFIIDKNLDAGNIINVISKIDKQLIKEVILFDVYNNEQLFPDKKSIAISVKIQPIHNNLSEAELINIREKIINIVKQNFSAKLRDEI